MTANGNVLTQLAAELARGAIRVVDLTQPLGPDTPVLGLPPPFANSPGVSFETISQYDDKGPAWYWRTIRMGEHTGTHFDAPVHWVSGKDRADNTLDTIPAERFVGPACVIDISAEASANPDFLLTRDGVLAWEARHGRIPPKSWVLLRSDWSKRVGVAEFLNCREDGPHSPGFDRGATELLALERDVLGVGVETVGTDAGQAHSFDPPFWTHHIMQGNGKFGLASLANLDRLPPTGAVVVASPLKLVGGSGSPLRVLALVPA
ncbi:cyclase family protein [Aromatoleum petrolei]|uniref:Cyclase family protein n=1 Tax=Aromatoleum petrolei TaxID=76116 RepID=A0ABX1MU38_9RHOO|nr:cyclase family protein [Aromatoleum petrolei]NMF90103.1 cyclase family protein [Aromatoleum petrolei]QTQ34223.1 Kynurenine formamidase superfamily protein [Aromatoleum petrolei]